MLPVSPGSSYSRLLVLLTSVGRKNHERPLDCWKEVEYFKRSVSNLEADFVASLR